MNGRDMQGRGEDRSSQSPSRRGDVQAARKKATSSRTRSGRLGPDRSHRHHVIDGHEAVLAPERLGGCLGSGKTVPSDGSAGRSLPTMTASKAPCRNMANRSAPSGARSTQGGSRSSATCASSNVTQRTVSARTPCRRPGCRAAKPRSFGYRRERRRDGPPGRQGRARRCRPGTTARIAGSARPAPPEEDEGFAVCLRLKKGRDGDLAHVEALFAQHRSEGTVNGRRRRRIRRP